jgi:ABC-2 type transport system ATP-binding protein
MLQTLGLSKQFGATKALDAVTLRVDPGEIYCLLGANGAGKTTLVNVFLNFVEPSEGEARVDGLDVTREPLATKQRLAYIPEQVMLYGALSGLENLRYFAALATGRKAGRDELLALLARVGLDATAAARRVATYSKGMRQKVGIAIALAKNAKALLLDEPTSGLDPTAIDEFHDLVRALADAGKAILMVTHDVYGACQVADRIGLLRGGHLVDQFEAPAGGRIDTETVHRAFSARAARAAA